MHSGMVGNGPRSRSHPYIRVPVSPSYVKILERSSVEFKETIFKLPYIKHTGSGVFLLLEIPGITDLFNS